MLITVSRQFGAGGSDVAGRVAAALDWRLVDNELVEQVAARAGLQPEEVAEMEERVPTFVERLARTLAAATPELVAHSPSGTLPTLEEADLVRITEAVVAEIAEQGKVVLVGRAAPVVLARRTDALHVRVVAPKPCRIARVAQRLAMPPDKAEELTDATDKMRARYSSQYYRRDWNDAANYHMVLNTEALGLDGTADLIVSRARALGW